MQATSRSGLSGGPLGIRKEKASLSRAVELLTQELSLSILQFDFRIFTVPRLTKWPKFGHIQVLPMLLSMF